MIAPSKKLYYAVEAVLYIAYNAGHGAISSREIAAKQGLTPRYLEQLLQKLVRSGILRGIRGPSGGYVLAKERRHIMIGDICGVLGNDADDLPPSMPLGGKIVSPVWKKARNHMMEYLGQTSLADLCDQALKANIRKAHEEKTDFTI